MNTRTNHGANITLERIEDTFALPTPPPGKEWHRTDGWTAEMLPPGTRPLCFDEHSTNKTQQLYRGRWVNLADAIMADSIEDHLRTTRPLLFQHAGHEWVWHRAGDPMPCDGERSVILLGAGPQYLASQPEKGAFWLWQSEALNCIGWRYADEAEAEAVAVDPYAELKAAHAAGLVIQFRSITALEAGHWASPVDLSPKSAIDWGYPVECFRIKPDDGPQWIEWHGGECFAASAGYPCLLRRAWICLVLKRKEARVAAAASTLACHAWNTGDDALWEQMYPLQEKLWDAIYAKDND
jgi:hypothetical protein